MKKIKRYTSLLVIVIFCIQNISISSVKALNNEGNIESIVSSINKAKEWISNNENEDGTWGKNEETKLYISSEVFSRFKDDELFSGRFEKLKEEVKQYNYSNIDFFTRKNQIFNEDTFTSKLKELQNEDGGFGLYKEYSSDVFDTTLVLRSILDNKEVDTELAIKAIMFLINNQNSNGSWSYILNGEENLELTSSILITLRYFIDKCELTSEDINTAINKGGEYINATIGEMNENNERLREKLLAYRALLKTIGVDNLEDIKTYVLSLQNSDGSWNNDIINTLYAIDLLNDINVIEENEIKSEITKVETFKLQDDELVETTNFMAKDTAFINVEYTSDSSKENSINILIKSKDGKVIKVNEQNNIYYWNIGLSKAGEYDLIVQLIDKEKNIVGEVNKKLTVDKTFGLNSMILNTSKDSIRIGEEANIKFFTTISLDTNESCELLAELVLVDKDNRIIYSKSNTVNVDKPTALNIDLGETKITASDGQKYFVDLKLTRDGTVISKENKELKVLPKLPATRIDLSQSTTKEWIYSGTDQVEAKYLLTGVGTPVLPDRKPYDLILAIDVSSSISNTNLDAQKKAAKKLVSLMRDDDRVGIIEFGTNEYCKLLMDDAISSDKDKLYSVIDSIKSQGYDYGTHIGIPVRKSTEILINKDSGNRDKMILMITDGGSWGDSNDAIEAKNNNIKISTVAINASEYYYDQVRIKSISTATGGTYYPTNSADEIIARMDEFMGSLFKYAGSDITCELNVPNKNVTIKETTPKADSIINNSDGSQTVIWKQNDLIMGQTSEISVLYEGHNLKQDTEEVLSNNFKISYTNLNNEKEIEEIQELKIPVAKFRIDNLVKLSNKEVLPNEELKIDIISKNMTKYESISSGKIEILDQNGNIVTTLDEFNEITWNPYEIKKLSYIWNSENRKSGKYGIRITWVDTDNNELVQNEEFTIKSDGDLINSITTNKIEYLSNEDVMITTNVSNASSNKILQNAVVKTYLTDSNGITSCISTNKINELQSNSSIKFNDVWNTEKNKAGEYVLTSILYGSNKEIIKEDKALFSIKETVETNEKIRGTLELDKYDYSDKDTLSLNYKLINIGNVNITDLKYSLKILDINGKEVTNILNDKVNLPIDEMFDKNLNYLLKELEEGEYFVNLEVVNDNGEKIILDWQKFNLKKELGLRVQLRNEWNTWVTENTIYPQFRIYNDSDKSINLDGLKLRYYYTTEGDSEDSFIYDWGNVFRGYIKGTINKIKNSTKGYLEIEMLPGSGILEPGKYIELHTRIIKSNWSEKFNQGDDYSFNFKTTEFIDWNKVTAYMSDKKIWGIEPKNYY